MAPPLNQFGLTVHNGGYGLHHKGWEGKVNKGEGRKKTLETEIFVPLGLSFLQDERGRGGPHTPPLSRLDPLGCLP